MIEKKCKKCGIVKSIGDFYQYNSKRNKRYYSRCKICTREEGEKWRTENRGRVNELQRKYNKKRDKADPKRRLRQSITAGVYDSIKKGWKSKRTFELLGYSLEDLKRHLESLFQEGMTFENYGEWHIDHKIPISVFNFDKPEQIDFKRCWALENLQPMWAKENLRKSAKILSAFQPSLKLDSA